MNMIQNEEDSVVQDFLRGSLERQKKYEQRIRIRIMFRIMKYIQNAVGLKLYHELGDKTDTTWLAFKMGGTRIIKRAILSEVQRDFMIKGTKYPSIEVCGKEILDCLKEERKQKQ